LNHRFDTVTDCGLFHTFSDDDRTQFVKSLRAVLNESGTYFMLCFSDKEPADWGGPRRIAQREIKETFHGGWRINYIREAKISTTQENIYGYAWLCSISIA